MKPIRVYVAGPYTKPDPVSNTRRALITANVLHAMGYVPFVPHLTLFWDLFSPRPYEQWLEYDNQWLAVCDVILRIPGESSGADKECELAKSLGIPVVTTYDELKARFPLAS